MHSEKMGQEEGQKKEGIYKLKHELGALRKPSRALENNIARTKVHSC